ncbi:acyltransferase, WS/DGAT/MGAT [Mycobacterium bohemicum DSM 44277]|uniref:Diacylglycerol O-acyltransferase n=2 Tax=Mycobacterium bohemicum TaxID=56425 RepID=A0A1X1R1B7_MYCBE|nr:MULTISPECIES: wax ester/triacylglycerol synthase family O-acyltransferase [Mycobacterium]MCV6971408.1 wax ester/triacylglycerol synthase family O-acyltransferase [Mycobacterium bohemicum]MCV7093297.1 wax ester/triacylglycerol synthase family O-acyltransferase [Mycobacterium interjectum]ORU97847.1 acyltransferase [Mycobacterium bohemicum]CPR07280.1 acyltransferase, WS/DGAT/MGAT [Mycobacterium bohemicum DSM 44277]
MQQLSWTDDMMLRAERPATPLQIQLLLIYDPSTAPDGKVTFKGILEELDARLHLADVFRRRLTELPGGLQRPYWVDDPSFDLEYHVRHIGLPQPGDWRQLCIQVARLHARPIDLRRPPWEITVIEGLNSVPGVPKGSFAMALKLHHCAVDGMASVEMIAAMHDLAADSPRPAGPESPWRPDALPTTANLLSRTAFDAALYPLRAALVLASNAPKAVRGLAGLPGKLVDGVASRVAGGSLPSFAPKTRFNQTVSPHRVFEARFHDLADFKRIKASVPGSTINDVALAYVGGALREYLGGHGELPDESLVAACPISLRDAGDKTSNGNALFGRLQSLGTDIADPLKRLAMIAEETAPSRAGSDQSTTTQLLELVGIMPTSLLGMTAKAASVLPFSGPTVANTTVTNVPGPTEPIFFSGARLVRAAGLGPLVAGLNLIHVVASYNGTLSISATADRDALPDPATYAQCMQTAFEELLASAGRAG